MENITLPGPQQLMPGEAYNIPQAGTLQDTSAARDVRKLDPYCFMEHTFDGSHGYRDNTYLIPNDREMFYETRRKISYYVNVFRPIILAMVNPIFTGNIKRETSSEMFAGFIANCDNAGTPLNIFMKNILTSARLYSVAFIVMDNFSAPILAEAETAEEQAAQRKYPYIYEKKPYEVHEHETSEQGALTSITFCDRIEETKDESGKREYRRYYREWTANTWELYYKIEGKDEEIVVEEGTHGLGRIPVIAVVDFAASAALKTLPMPAFYDMAFLAFGLYNKESQVCFMEVMQTFAILCTSGMGATAKAIGPATFLDSGTDSKYPPQYVAPPQDGIRTLIENCQRLKDEIKDQAKQKGVIGVVKASSGVAKEWDFRAEESVLKETAAAGERVELVLADIFGLYLGSAIAYTVEYPRQFSPTADIDDINTALLVLDKAPPRGLANALWLDIAERRWKNNPEKIESIRTALEADVGEAAAIQALMAAEKTTEPVE